MGKKALKIISFFIPTIVFLIVIELAARLLNLPPYPDNHNRHLFVENPYANFSLHKGFNGTMNNLEYMNKVYVDSLGFRNFSNGNVGINKNKRRIYLAGDSMTFGQGVDFQDTFGALLSKNSSFQVFNTGVPSYGTMHELGLLKQTGKQISPDTVVLVFYMGNDFYDNWRGFTKHVIGGYLTDDKDLNLASIVNNVVDYPVYSEQVYLNGLDKILVKSSALYRYLRYKGLFIPKIRAVYEQAGITDSDPCALPYSTSPYMKGYTQHPQYKHTINIILDFKKYVENDLHAKLIMINIPIREQVYTKMYEYEKSQGCLKKGEEFDINYPSAYMREFAKKNNITYIDPTSALKRSLDEGKNPFFTVDSHINPTGHQVIYQLLSEQLKKQ